ncbi:type I restriction-modification system subunit M [Candidatus Poriferisocius sp.]|uniref:type I restriction-modification system subunit M n=1 Tax=Candidatus Poriferisocius sp. TaxID=3101276 RepID=UPI003B02278F
MESEKINNHAAFIWSVADLLRGVYKQSEYGRVILPLTVLRRLDCVLEPTKEEVLAAVGRLPDTLQNRDPLLAKFAGQSFFNTSRHTFATLLGDPDNVAGNLRNYIAGFSESARDIVDKFNFDGQIDRLNDHNLLYLVVSKFADLDLSPETVSDLDMGYLYEELIRRFSELSNETAGEHFTPREVIRLMVNLLFREDDELLTKPGIVKTLLDPACGTGGMLSVAEDYLRQLNPEARLMVFGQEVNAETYATCRADMLIKGQEASNIKFGNSFDDDQHQGERFDYLLANPPFGVEWKMVADKVKDEHAIQGFAGRFGAGLPRINDGSFLFLQHMIDKMKRRDEGGARLAIVFNGSPLFTGGAGSGESEIRRWIIESDMLEAVVALPDQLFYNTGIATYIWVVTNRKAPPRRGKVQLVDARDQFTKTGKSLGQKRKELSPDQIDEIARLYGSFEEGPQVKIFPNESFGFLHITVERPLRLRWEITDDTLSVVGTDKKVAKLDYDRRESLLTQLRARRGDVYSTERAAQQAAQEALQTAAADKPAAIVKAVTEALAIRDPDAPIITDRSGTPKPDPDLRDYENVPLPPMAVPFEPDPAARLQAIEYSSAVDDYIQAEVHPYVPDAWHDPDKAKIGYEIPLARHFFTYVPPRSLREIDAEINMLESEIQSLLLEIAE